jgi:CHAD domain-containing protein
MAYRLKPRRALGKELSRIVARQFRAAVERLGESGVSDEAVHEARKRIKKIRAALRLVHRDRESIGGTQNELRKVAHGLSSLRDVDIMAETMAAVRAHDPGLVTPAISSSINQGLAATRRAGIARRAQERLVTRAARALSESASNARHQVGRFSGSHSIEAGAARAYRRARQAMVRARRNPDDLLFHAWRRRAKDHWYHMRLLEAISAAARGRARTLKRLDGVLGNEHNLTLLRETILNAPERFGHRAAATVVGVIETYQTQLRKRALTLGGRLFARRPRTFRKSVKAWLHSTGTKT